MQVSSCPSSPCGQGTAPSFYRPRGGSLQSCHTVLHATYGGMVHSDVELMAVLTNLARVGRRGESCTCPGAASRVAVCHTCFSKENQVINYMYARIKFHTYSDIISE
jgi:hypothetical protein